MDDWQGEQEERRAAIAHVEAGLIDRAHREAELWNERMPPDLQKLVELHGGWNEIPPEVWDRYYRELEAWRDRIRHGDFYWKMQALEARERE